MHSQILNRYRHVVCRVLTVSFHKYGNYFFPGTGDLKDIGERHGKFYSINVPMRDGTDDATFHRLFKPIMAKVMEVFSPGAVVLQCGALPPSNPLIHITPNPINEDIPPGHLTVSCQYK